MRYRHVEQAFSVRSASAVGCVMSGLHCPCMLCGNLERLTVFSDAAGGVQQPAHSGDEGELRWLSGGAQAFVKDAQPGFAAHRAEHGHPRRHEQAGIAEGYDADTCAGALAGLLKAGHDADVCGEGGSTGEACWIADGGDDAGCGLRPDALDGGQQLADLMSVEQVLDVILDFGKAITPQVEALAYMHMAGLQRVGRSVMLADQACRCLDQLAAAILSQEASRNLGREVCQ